MRSTPNRLSERASLFVALGAALALSLLGLFELRSRLFTNELMARNSAERSINLLMQATRQERRRLPDQPPRAGPWGFNPLVEGEEYVEALERYEELRERIAAVAVYGQGGRRILSWGSAPAHNPFYPDDGALPLPPEDSGPGRGRSIQSPERERLYRLDWPRRRLLVAQAFPRMGMMGSMHERPGESWFLYWELHEARLFTRQILALVIYALWLLAAFAGSLFVRRVILRNRQYRDTLREQEELVALGSAAATLAHEIKNPLSAIGLQLDLLERECAHDAALPAARDRPSPGAQPEFTEIRGELTRIRDLVNRIGSFLRKGDGPQERIDLKQLAEEARRTVDAEQTISIETDTSGALAVRANPEQLRSIVTNLLQNALEAGSRPEGIQMSLHRNAARAILEVADRGAGIPDELDPERLFIPFFTTKTRGFGLGLALARRFARDAGGDLVLERRKGGGSRARLSLPLDSNDRTRSAP